MHPTAPLTINDTRAHDALIPLSLTVGTLHHAFHQAITTCNDPANKFCSPSYARVHLSGEIVKELRRHISTLPGWTVRNHRGRAYMTHTFTHNTLFFASGSSHTGNPKRYAHPTITKMFSTGELHELGAHRGKFYTLLYRPLTGGGVASELLRFNAHSRAGYRIATRPIHSPGAKDTTTHDPHCLPLDQWDLRIMLPAYIHSTDTLPL
ncbi:hypothetical protein [Corynebacterium aquilae]|uniref:Uncharacterized protein n=1 Tax=Corynebacterium aquilae DSM 44791 TaxID=1431546 RepID=A0A1L7CDS6_9CORY|nr:hypothetical protein [Corynebacterium aquilae]APT83933.1 hypothetical protein CAQU_01315 [Corynebacterium aquilae DSM 44791]